MKVPGEQLAQDAGALAKVPAGQVAAEKAQDGAPATLNAPTPQEAQALGTLPPALGLYVPAAQLAQVAWPSLCWNLPGAQAAHADKLVAPCALLEVPAGQALQVALPVALQEPTAQQAPAPALLKLPTGQGDALPCQSVRKQA